MYKYEFEKRKLYSYLGNDLVELFKDNKCIIAGGAITSIFNNREINDIDIYFRSIDKVESLLNDIWGTSQWILAQTDKALLLKHDGGKLIQLIYFDVFNGAEAIFNTFDFTVCMGAFDFEKEEFIFHNDFFKHNCERLLKFNGKTAYPIVSALRVKKYEDKGYTISKPEFVRIVLACMNMNITSYQEIKEQLGGMYGVNYDKYFKPIENEEFSLEKTMDILENLIYDEDYFKESKHENGFYADYVEDILLKIKGYKPKYFNSVKGNTYKVTSNGKIKELTKDLDIDSMNIEKVDVKELFNNLSFYKFVQKKDDGYFSYFDSKFEYKIGEEAIAKEVRRYCVGQSGIYVSELKEINCTTYSSKKDKVLLELKGTYEDFISGEDSQLIFKKCNVVREVPYEEYEEYLGKKNK